ncbi:hypothetical protein Tco_0633495, partial [Tanacetum coccineum]
GFEQFQPPQFSVIHQPPQETNTKILQARENLMEAIQAFLKKYDHIPPREKCMALLLAEERFLKVKQALEKGQNQPEKCPIFDDDDDEEYTIQVREYYKNSPVAITPDFLITDSLIMEDEHLDTIPERESDEENESSVENLNLTPSESEDLSDIESECDVPVCDDFMTFSNPLFDSYNDSTSSDDESFSDEDVPKENFKIYSNPLFDEEIISTKIDPHHFNAESDLIESLLNKNTVITSPKIDFLLEEFAGELALINPIPPGIAETNFDPKEDIRLIKKLLYDNSSPRPPEELNSENDFEKENSGSTTIHTNISLPEYESFDDESDSASEIFNDDLAHIIPPSEYEYVYADDESESGDLTTDVVEDISGDLTRKLQMSHRGFKALKISHNFFNKSPMMIYGGACQSWMPRISIFILLDQLKYKGSSQAHNLVNKNKALLGRHPMIAPDCEDSRARGFVH